MDGNITLLYRMAALHVVYKMNKSQMLWFGQLVAHSPGIMVHLKKETICDRNEMVLSICKVSNSIRGDFICL